METKIPTNRKIKRIIMKIHQYLYNNKHGFVCYNDYKYEPDPGSNVVVFKNNIPIKTTYSKLHIDKHIDLIKYLKGLNI